MKYLRPIARIIAVASLGLTAMLGHALGITHLYEWGGDGPLLEK